MKNLLLTVMAALTLSTVAVTTANAACHKFERGMTPSQIAAAGRISLASDPTGNSPIKPQECARDKSSCATMNMYLQMLQKAVPPMKVKGKPLTSVGQVPDAFDSLKEVTPPAGVEYWNSAVCERPDGTLYAQDHFSPRAFYTDRGEKAYAYRTEETSSEKSESADGDETTTRNKKREIETIVLMGDCDNIVFGKFETAVSEVTVVANPCLEVHYYSDNEDVIAIHTVGPQGSGDMPDPRRCIKLKQAGQTTASAQLPHDECAEGITSFVEGNRKYTRDCRITNPNFQDNLEMISQMVQKRVAVYNPSAGYVAKRGENILYVPRTAKDYFIVICRRRADGTQYNAKGVRGSDYNSHGVVMVKDWVIAPGQ